MRLYWTLASIPELAGLPSRERRKLWRASRARIAPWKLWVARWVLVLSMPVGAAAGRFTAHSTLGAMVGLAVATLLGLLISGQITTRAALPHLRQMIAETNSLPTTR